MDITTSIKKEEKIWQYIADQTHVVKDFYRNRIMELYSPLIDIFSLVDLHS